MRPVESNLVLRRAGGARRRALWLAGVGTLVALVLPASALASGSGPVCEPARAAAMTSAGPGGAQHDALVPCRYSIGADAGEPSFAFGRRGEIFYETWDLDAPYNPSGVVRSNAAHTAWTDVSPPGLLTSYDPYLYIDPRTGRIFDTNYAGSGNFECSTVSTSDDSGASWSTSELCGIGFDGGSLGAGRPVYSRPSGYPDVVYYCASATLGSVPPNTSPACGKSLDGGKTFTPITPPFPTAGSVSDEFGPWSAPPVVGPDGTVYVAKRYGGEPMLAISHDEGTTWTDVQVAGIGSASEQGRVAVDAAGDLLYSWQAADHQPYLVTSRDGGRHFSQPLALAPAGLRETALARVAVDPAGDRAAVVYLGSSNAPGAAPYATFCQEFLETCTDGGYASATWNGYMSVVENPLGRRPRVATASVKPPAEPLFQGGCTPDGGCKANLDFLDVKFDAGGTPWGAFVDDCALTAEPGAAALAYNPGYGRCEDGTGEGLLLSLRPAGGDNRASG